MARFWQRARGLQRSLRLHEIVDQVLSAGGDGSTPSHIVFMGMGYH